MLQRHRQVQDKQGNLQAQGIQSRKVCRVHMSSAGKDMNGTSRVRRNITTSSQRQKENMSLERNNSTWCLAQALISVIQPHALPPPVTVECSLKS